MIPGELSRHMMMTLASMASNMSENEDTLIDAMLLESLLALLPSADADFMRDHLGNPTPTIAEKRQADIIRHRLSGFAGVRKQCLTCREQLPAQAFGWNNFLRGPICMVCEPSQRRHSRSRLEREMQGAGIDIPLTLHPIVHGWSGYCRNCRCEICNAAAEEWHRARAPTSPREPGTFKHGSTAYRRGRCRCPVCKAAMRAAGKNYRARRKAAQNA